MWCFNSAASGLVAGSFLSCVDQFAETQHCMLWGSLWRVAGCEGLCGPVSCRVLQKEQLEVTDVVVLIDREQGGAAHLAKNGLTLHAAFKLSSMLDVLQQHKLVDEDVAGKVRAFIAENQTQLPTPAAAPAAAKRSVSCIE